MTTREEFDEMVARLVLVAAGVRPDATAGIEIAAAYDAQAARITELEVALRAALPWIASQIEYPGDPVEKVANGVRALLSKEA